MSNLRQAAQQALEDICGARLCEVNSMSSRREALRLLGKAADALRAALAEPEQEPVAWMYECVGDTRFAKKLDTPGMHRTESVPLYTAPPQRKPLTDEELEVLWDDATDRMEHFCSQYWDFARAIEAAHGIKGEA